jgi:hypothetical protein
MYYLLEEIRILKMCPVNNNYNVLVVVVVVVSCCLLALPVSVVLIHRC